MEDWEDEQDTISDRPSHSTEERKSASRGSGAERGRADLGDSRNGVSAPQTRNQSAAPRWELSPNAPNEIIVTVNLADHGELKFIVRETLVKGLVLTRPKLANLRLRVGGELAVGLLCNFKELEISPKTRDLSHWRRTVPRIHLGSIAALPMTKMGEFAFTRLNGVEWLCDGRWQREPAWYPLMCIANEGTRQEPTAHPEEPPAKLDKLGKRNIKTKAAQVLSSPVVDEAVIVEDEDHRLRLLIDDQEQRSGRQPNSKASAQTDSLRKTQRGHPKPPPVPPLSSRGPKGAEGSESGLRAPAPPTSSDSVGERGSDPKLHGVAFSPPKGASTGANQSPKGSASPRPSPPPKPKPKPPPPPSDSDGLDLVGRNFGLFRVSARLRTAVPGALYYAHHSDHGTPVVLRVLPQSDHMSSKHAQWLRREVKVLQRVEHPNLAQILELAEDHGLFALVLSPFAGHSLAEILSKRGRFAVGKPLRLLLTQVLDALGHAHGYGLVHRSLDPTKIVVDVVGGLPEVRVIDFGLSRVLSSGANSQSLPDAILASPRYMSPEQFLGRDVSFSSDIYSLGVVLYELTTGHLPFDGRSDDEIRVGHLRNDPPDPRSHNPAIGVLLQEVIFRALVKEPAGRWPDARSFREALCQAIPK